MTTSLSETHHAVLFALIARETIQFFGQRKGEAGIRKAIRQYGKQRGRRMAMRSQAAGQELTMTNFLIFGEWQPSGFSRTQSTMEEIYPDVRMKVMVCPWNNAWIEYNLLEYGRIYCKEIDEALVNGYNHELSIEVGKTLSNDGQPCEFVYRDASLIGKETLEVIRERRVESLAENTMPWDYHCGHLYHTFQNVLIEEFGATGQKAIQTALNKFGSLFDKETIQIILSFQEIDFDQLPD